MSKNSLRESIAALGTRIAFGAHAVAGFLASVLRVIWRPVRRPLSIALQVVAALVLLFEEWGWRPLVAALAYLTRFKLWARLELLIAGLPPYGALLALALPTSVLFPLKLVSIFLLSNGQLVAAALLFVGAKVLSTALIARLFLLTKPSLMRIGWFAAIYNVVMPWKEALFAIIRASWVWRYGRMLKNRVRRSLHRWWAAWRPVAVDAWRRVRAEAQSLWMRVRVRRDGSG